MAPLLRIRFPRVVPANDPPMWEDPRLPPCLKEHKAPVWSHGPVVPCPLPSTDQAKALLTWDHTFARLSSFTQTASFPHRQGFLLHPVLG